MIKIPFWGVHPGTLWYPTMTINTALTVPIILFKIIFIALFHVLGHADHKNDYYLFFYFIYFFPNMPQNPI